MFAGIALTALLAGCSPQIESYSYNEGINVIPIPVELTRNEGEFTLTSNSVIVVTSPEAAQAAAYLGAKIKASTGYNLSVVKEKPATNYITIGVNSLNGLKKEGYTLKSSAQGVEIEGVDGAGAFYGVQTMLQLLPAQIESTKRVKSVAWTMPAVNVVDYPRFEYRGLMLDVCRHFVDVEFIKKQLDVLSMYKINRFHWHLTEDQAWRIEIKKYPKLTELGSVRTEGDGSTYGPFFFTQEQIKEVIAYATERFIDVIPEIELPGHALAALTAYPEYSCTGGPFSPRIIWGVEEDVYCAGNDATFEFLQDIIDEVIELFPSEYIHIGGDECPKSQWEQCSKCQARIAELGYKGYTDEFGMKHSKEYQLQSYFVTRIGQHIDKRGKKMIGWDEILEGGLAPGAIVMSWRGTEGGIAAAKQGHQAIMTPGPGGMYIDHYQGAPEVEQTAIGGYAPLSKTYSYEPLPAELSEEQHHFIMGAQANMWSEYLLSPEAFEYQIYPRIIAVAELTWSPKSRKDFEDFERRILNTYARLDYHNINYHIPNPEGVLTQNVVYTGDSIELEFTNTRNLPMVYTLDGTTPNKNSKKVENVVVVNDPNATIMVATLLPTGKTSVARSIPVAKEELSPAVEPQPNPELEDLRIKLKADKNQTIRVRTAPGLFVSETEYANAQFGEDTLVSSFRGGVKYDMAKPSLSIYEGYVELPEDGVYTFSTDLSELYIDGVQLINNNKTLARHNSKKVQKALAAGKHSYKLVFNNMIKDGWPTVWSEIGFWYQKPSGGNLQRVTADMISY